MSIDLSGALLSQLIEVPCPRCGYVLQVQFLDVATQVYRVCPCCYVRIHLRDGNGSVCAAQQDINASIQALSDTIRKAFK